jgi:hypothetical protein
VYLPVVLVDVPVFVPLTVILTPDKALPLSPVTVPETVIVSCAANCVEVSNKRAVRSLNRPENSKTVFLTFLKNWFIFLVLKFQCKKRESPKRLFRGIIWDIRASAEAINGTCIWLNNSLRQCKVETLLHTTEK